MKMLGNIWRRFLRLTDIGRRFPPPRIEGDAQARVVLGALYAFLTRDADRFDSLFLGGKPLAPENAERPLMEVLAAAGYVKAGFHHADRNRAKEIPVLGLAERKTSFRPRVCRGKPVRALPMPGEVTSAPARREMFAPLRRLWSRVWFQNQPTLPLEIS